MDDPIESFNPVEINPSFEWPVDKARLTRGFLPDARPRPHLGLDLAAIRGTPIYAAQGGTVIYAGTGFSGYGRFIIIENEIGWATFYSHLDKMLVKNGEKVEKGQKIGKMGRTGRATGTHLHFEVRKDKKAIDPLAFLPKGSDWVQN
jgi:murein DD-endopeptidase MepM/ murein hydrolase activator NlpD